MISKFHDAEHLHVHDIQMMRYLLAKGESGPAVILERRSSAGTRERYYYSIDQMDGSLIGNRRHVLMPVQDHMQNKTTDKIVSSMRIDSDDPKTNYVNAQKMITKIVNAIVHLVLHKGYSFWYDENIDCQIVITVGKK